MYVNALSAKNSTSSTAPYIPVTQTAAAAETISTQKLNTDTTTEYSPRKKKLQEIVREYFSDAPILSEIAKCESGFVQWNSDGSVLRGNVNKSDVGIMQINEYYHAKEADKLGYDLHSLEGNLAFARHLYTREGTAPWSASEKCWSRTEVATL